jgi:hypothetical protein
VTSVEVLGRLVLGMPADISWRYERDSWTSSERRAMERSKTMMQQVSDRGLTVLSLILAAFSIVPGTLALLNVGSDLTIDERLFLGPLAIAAGLVILSGLYVSDRSPWLVAGLLSVAAIGMALLMYWRSLTFTHYHVTEWESYILALAALVVITLAVLRARRLDASSRSAPAG